jgi:hypothetical protein
MDVMNWRKSSYSGSNGAECVEVADDDGNRVLVRDTKNQAGAMLRLTPEVWQRFADQVKRSLTSTSTGKLRGRGLLSKPKGPSLRLDDRMVYYSVLGFYVGRYSDFIALSALNFAAQVGLDYRTRSSFEPYMDSGNPYEPLNPDLDDQDGDQEARR